MKKTLASAGFLMVALVANPASSAKCEWNFDILGLEEEWSVEQFLNDLPDNAVCEIGSQLRGSLEDVAEAWAKKAAISALDGFTGGMFSILAGTVSGSGQPRQPDYSLIIGAMDQIIEAHFNEYYRNAFEDRKIAYETNYTEYMETTALIPILFLKQEADNGTISTGQTSQFNFAIDRMQYLLDEINILLAAQGIFGSRNHDRFRAGKVFVTLAGQRIALRRELNFALGYENTSTARRRKETVEAMLDELAEWVDGEHVTVITARGTGAGIPCTIWEFEVNDVSISSQLKEKRRRRLQSVAPPGGRYSADEQYSEHGGRYCWVPGSDIRLPADFRNDIVAVETEILKEHFFGPNVDLILANWVSKS